MSKQALYDYSTTASSNSDFDGTDSSGATGKVKDGDNYSRSIAAHVKGFALDLGAANTVAGTGDAITVTLASNPTALVDGMRISINAPGTNTGAATIAVTNSGATLLATPKIRKWASGAETALSAGDITSGHILNLVYDSARDSASGAFMIDGSASVAAATTGAAGIVELATLAETLAGTDTGRVPSVSTLYFPTGHLYGLGMANGTDATNDINFSAGTCRDSSDSQNIIATAKVKQLDANWAAGTNQGGRYSGAAITNTTYHCYAVAKALGADPDFYFDPSATEATVLGHLQAETGGADYLYVRRIGSIVRTGGAIKAFVQRGDTFQWATPVVDVDDDNPGTSAVTRTLTVPTGIVVTALITGGFYQGTSQTVAYFSALAINDTAPQAPGTASLTGAVSVTAGANIAQWILAPVEVDTNTSAQIRSRLSASGAADRIGVITNGWIDNRGRL